MSSEEEPSGESGDENDLERIQEGEDIENEVVEPHAEVNETEGDNVKNEDENKKVVKPKRVIRNPQPKLNEETLKGQRGIAALPVYFERVKFKGRGHEEQDLNVLMKTYEYWCHRLFPKFPFDDSIARLEKLGTKRAVQTHIKRIRMDLLVDDILLNEDGENNPQNVDNNTEETEVSQFDQLLNESNISQEHEPTEINEEQMERIRRNKERAEKLRMERLQKIREKAKENINPSNFLSSNQRHSEDIMNDNVDSQEVPPPSQNGNLEVNSNFQENDNETSALSQTDMEIESANVHSALNQDVSQSQDETVNSSEENVKFIENTSGGNREAEEMNVEGILEEINSVQNASHQELHHNIAENEGTANANEDSFKAKLGSCNEDEEMNILEETNELNNDNDGNKETAIMNEDSIKNKSDICNEDEEMDIENMLEEINFASQENVEIKFIANQSVNHNKKEEMDTENKLEEVNSAAKDTNTTEKFLKETDIADGQNASELGTHLLN